jgi:phosphonate transport system substrate-binding protein
MTGRIVQSLRFANFLSPALFPTYERIVGVIARATGISASLETGENLEDLTEGRFAGAFICGLQYVHLARASQKTVELSAAPLLLGERYQQPWYFSDIVVRWESPFTSFADLAGCTWAYNEVSSHSGYNLIYSGLLQRNLTPAYFGNWRASGAHVRSLELVVRGEVDATAIDSHVLAALLRDDPQLAEQVRLIGSFGPSAVPPVVVSRSLDVTLRRTIREALLTMAHDPVDAEYLRQGFIERFVPVQDAWYDDIREMYDRVQADCRVLL